MDENVTKMTDIPDPWRTKLNDSEMNTTNLTDFWQPKLTEFTEPWRTSPTDRLVVTLVFGAILVTGIVGNLTVLALICVLRRMQTTVNLCLASLALADLIVLGFLPIMPLIDLHRLDAAIIGRNLCYFLSTIDRGAVACSILTFLLVSAERFAALCRPLQTLRPWRRRNVITALVVIWLLAAAISAPFAFATQYTTIANETSANITYCWTQFELPWVMWYEVGLTCVFIFLPVPFLVFLYGKMIAALRKPLPRNDSRCVGARHSRTQVIVMLLVVVTMFIVCQVPFKIFIFLYMFEEDVMFKLEAETVFAINWTVRMLQYVNNIANPIVYFVASSNFRSAFREVFCRRFGSRCTLGQRRPPYSMPSPGSQITNSGILGGRPCVEQSGTTS